MSDAQRKPIRAFSLWFWLIFPNLIAVWPIVTATMLPRSVQDIAPRICGVARPKTVTALNCWPSGKGIAPGP